MESYAMSCWLMNKSKLAIANNAKTASNMPANAKDEFRFRLFITPVNINKKGKNGSMRKA